MIYRQTVDWRGKRVFISGGNGVIGNELVRYLHKAGAVLLVGDLKPRPLDWSPEIQYRQGDLNYIEPGELQDFAPQIFFHLAATFERSVESYEFWSENYQHNIRLGHHLVTATKDLPSIEQIIFASSYLIYDPEQYFEDTCPENPVSLKETDPIYPRNLTGVAKLNHEIELRFLNEFRGDQISFCSARIYRSYGINSRDVISRWVRALLAGESIETWGQQSFFDYIFARDVALGLMKLAEVKKKPAVVNLGSGRARRVSDVIGVLRNHFPAAVMTEKPYQGSYEKSQADLTLLEELTGWRPPSTLETAIPEIIAYERSQMNKSTEVNERTNILVTSVSKKIPLLNAVKNAQAKFGSGKLIGADLDETCLGSHFVDGFWKMPRIPELTATQVIEKCREKEIRVIVPTRDAELPFWSKISAELKVQGITVMVSNPASVETCLDKLAFFHFSQKHAIPAIPTSTEINPDQPGRWVVKERFGAGSASLGLDLDTKQALAHAKTLKNPIYQPLTEGREISVDSYSTRDGKVKSLILRTRDLVVNGESQVTTTFRDENLEKQFEAILNNFQFFGHVVTQAFVTDKGLQLIEINPRFGGASTLSLAAGLDTFYWLILESMNQSATSLPFHRRRVEIRQIRYPKDSLVYGPRL